MFYREMQQDPSFDFENPDMINTQEAERAICPYLGSECPYSEDQEQALDPNLVRQRRRRRRIRRHRPYYYSRPYQYPFFPLYYLTYYPWDYDEYYY